MIYADRRNLAFSAIQRAGEWRHDFGYDHTFFESKLEPLRDLRNVADVGHYDLDRTAIDAINQHFGEAEQVVTDVIKRYRARLIQGRRAREPAEQLAP